MDQVKNQIHDVSTCDLREISDDRGSILHMIRNDNADFTKFGECYFSEIKPSAIKAWKRHRDQTQNLAVPVGRVRFVIFDSRVDSLSINTLQVIELGRPNNYKRLRIPPGLWYGFTCISDGTALIVNCTDLPHDTNESELVSVNSDEIPYTW